MLMLYIHAGDFKIDFVQPANTLADVFNLDGLLFFLLVL